MSYILDALRKSERERQLCQVPTLKSEHVLDNYTPKSKLPLIITILVVSNIGLVSLFLLNQNSSTDSLQSNPRGKEISSQSVNSGSKRQASRLIPTKPKSTRVSPTKLKSIKPTRKTMNASLSSTRPKPSPFKKSDTIALNPIKKSGEKSGQLVKPVGPKNVKQVSPGYVKNLELAKAAKSR